jgi:hypothetical protein
MTDSISRNLTALAERKPQQSTLPAKNPPARKSGFSGRGYQQVKDPGQSGIASPLTEASRVESEHVVTIAPYVTSMSIMYMDSVSLSDPGGTQLVINYAL